MAKVSDHVHRDTKIPKRDVPLIIVHWWHEYYYGGNLSVLDMRKYLETKLRTNTYSRDAVEAWVRNAEGWAILMDRYYPGRVQRYLQEYFQIHFAA